MFIINCTIGLSENFQLLFGQFSYRNNVIFCNYSVKPAHIINLTISLFNDMKQYNVASKIDQDCLAGTNMKPGEELEEFDLEPSVEDCMKLNVDAFRIQAKSQFDQTTL